MKPFNWKPETPPGVKDLYYWQCGKGTSFNCKIFELLGKADQDNQSRIALAWPQIYIAWHMWHSASNSDEFFEQFKDYVSTD